MNKALSEIHNIHISGRGTQAIVFIHGLGCDQSIWRYITPAFEDKFKIVLFDYIGSGKSDLSYYDDHRHSSLNGYAEDVLHICKELQLSNVILVAHSVSCMISMQAAISDPGMFAEIIMIAPSPSYINDGNYKGGFERKEMNALLGLMEKNYLQWASYISPMVIGNKNRSELMEEFTDRLCVADHEITRKFARMSFNSDCRNDTQNLTTSVLILQCAEDILAPHEVGIFLHQNFQESVIKVMEATGHCPHLSAPDETIHLITAYLTAKKQVEELT